MQIPKNIIVKDATGKTVAFLSPKADGLKDVYVDTRLNGESTLEFLLPATSEKITELTPECEIWAGDKVYILRKDEAMDTIRNDKNALWAKFMAVEKWYELDTSYVEPSISNDPTARPPADLAVIIVGGGSNLSGNRYPTGTAGHALYAILQGSGWTMGTVDVTGIRDLESEKESRLALIKKVQDIWGGYLVFDSINKIIHLRDAEKWQPYTGFQVRYKKNLKHITRTQSNKIVTKLYPFGHDDLDIANVNGGKKYITNHSYTSREYVGIYKNQDIYSQSELLEKAIAELELICRPRYLYKVKLVDVRVLPEYEHEDFKLGDMADIIDPDIAPDSPRPRIIRHKYNLFQPWNCELDIGDPEERLVEQLKASFGTTQFVDRKFKGDGKFSGHGLEYDSVGADKIKVNELVVGDNIKMGSNAYISWSNVTNQPDIAGIALDKINATYIDANGVWTPNVYAKNISTINGKITTAQIENLVVGGNVTMGPNAYISWGQIDDKPRDLAYLDDIPYLPDYIQRTYIDETRIESPKIYGGTIRGGRIISDSEIDVTTNAHIGNSLYMNATNFREGIYFNTFKTTFIGPNDSEGGVYIRGGLTVGGAANGDFRSADGKTIEVRGGIVTDIY
ncbi:phage minor structural protein [Tissierella praeacuta]|uniref:phage tail protein n=1 Tax=Tissierella praeacuta TaxID=43131 RepID=UPI00104D79DD|nr:phage tail protein [Tissierella praeacuta]TCU72858.1 phage minor structural protein [Tissierella praeacuta]